VYGRAAEAYVQGAELGVRVLVVDALFERAHGLFGLYRLRSDDVGDLEVEGDVFTANGCKSAQGLVAHSRRGGLVDAYRLLLVALSICSSRAVLAPDDHHPIILRGGTENWECAVEGEMGGRDAARGVARQGASR
jgi:hypothetical protein